MRDQKSQLNPELAFFYLRILKKIRASPEGVTRNNYNQPLKGAAKLSRINVLRLLLLLSPGFYSIR